jgi:hypothetical protein
MLNQNNIGANNIMHDIKKKYQMSQNTCMF